jgi:hypothetical protein
MVARARAVQVERGGVRFMAAEPMREDDQEIYGLCAACSAPLRAWEFERDGVTVLGLSCSQEATHDPD